MGNDRRYRDEDGVTRYRDDKHRDRDRDRDRDRHQDRDHRRHHDQRRRERSRSAEREQRHPRDRDFDHGRSRGGDSHRHDRDREHRHRDRDREHRDRERESRHRHHRSSSAHITRGATATGHREGRDRYERDMRPRQQPTGRRIVGHGQRQQQQQQRREHEETKSERSFSSRASVISSNQSQYGSSDCGRGSASSNSHRHRDDDDDDDAAEEEASAQKQEDGAASAPASKQQDGDAPFSALCFGTLPYPTKAEIAAADAAAQRAIYRCRFLASRRPAPPVTPADQQTRWMLQDVVHDQLCDVRCRVVSPLETVRRSDGATFRHVVQGMFNAASTFSDGKARMAAAGEAFPEEERDERDEQQQQQQQQRQTYHPDDELQTGVRAPAGGGGGAGGNIGDGIDVSPDDMDPPTSPQIRARMVSASAPQLKLQNHAPLDAERIMQECIAKSVLGRAAAAHSARMARMQQQQQQQQQQQDSPLPPLLPTPGAPRPPPSPSADDDAKPRSRSATPSRDDQFNELREKQKAYDQLKQQQPSVTATAAPMPSVMTPELLRQIERESLILAGTRNPFTRKRLSVQDQQRMLAAKTSNLAVQQH